MPWFRPNWACKTVQNVQFGGEIVQFRPRCRLPPHCKYQIQRRGGQIERVRRGQMKPLGPIRHCHRAVDCVMAGECQHSRSKIFHQRLKHGVLRFRLTPAPGLARLRRRTIASLNPRGRYLKVTEGLHKVMSSLSVEQFGALVRARRTEKGWSQEALAAAALGNGDRKGYISSIENGKQPNVTALTMQNIARALDMSTDEIDAMLGVVAPGNEEVAQELEQLRQEKGTLNAALSELRTLTRGQLIALATQFEINRAFELADPTLIVALTDKAEDYRKLRADVANIDERVAGLGNLKAAARDAIERLDLEEVETLLTRVDEVETEVAAETKELRAQNALLRGRVDEAYRIFVAAAESFGSFDMVEVARRRNKGCGHLYRHCRRYGGNGFLRAIDLVKPIATDDLRLAAPLVWGAVQNDLGLALENQGLRTQGAERADLLAQAVAAYTAALEVRTRADHPVRWAMTQNNLGNALLLQGERSQGAAGADVLAQAVAAYTAALEVYTRADHPVNWAMTQENLAEAKQALARHGGDTRAHLQAALAHVDGALEVFDPAHMSYNHGKASRLRDSILADLAAL